MARKIPLVLGWALALLTAAPAFAHHSGAPYDRRITASIQGEVIEWRWSNPHAWLKIRAPDKDGNMAEWAFEAMPATILSRQGWKRSTFQAGDKVTVRYNPIRDGSPGGVLLGATLADGSNVGVPPAP
jgi:hypothetical protein